MANTSRKFKLVFLFSALLMLATLAGAQDETETPASTAEVGVEGVSENAGEGEAAEERPVTLNFVDMDLSEVITNISKITGKNFIWDEKVRGKVTIISPEGIPVEEAWRVFEAVMRFNGYQLVRVKGVENLYKIIRIQEASGETIPTYTKGLWSPRTEAFVTRLLHLKYIDAQSASSVLNNLKSKDGKIIPYPPTNTLIVIESANNLNRLVRILKQMDVPLKLPQVKIVRLKHAAADKLAGVLSQIFSEELLGALMVGGEEPFSARGPRRPMRRRSEPTETKTAKTLKVIAETRTNSLIVIATEEIIDEVLRVISELDIPVEGEEGIFVYQCRNASAKELAATLSELAGAKGRSTTTISRSAGETPKRRTASPRGGAATVSLGTFTGEVKITADEPTNSLVIVANRRDYAILRQVIKKLDRRRRQVFVEAVILEVEMSGSSALGTSLAAAANLDNQAAVFGSTALGGLNSLGMLPALTSGSMTDLLPGGFSVGALAKTVTLNVGGTDVTIPTFSALFNALVATNNVNVLSTPNLLTTDNEEAEIIVGQNVPIPVGQTVSTGGTTTVTIQRQNVGIKLKVKPQISEGGTIRMVISTEISGVVQTAVAGIDVNTLGVTTSIKSAQTTVIVDNHQTVVIGGLIENRKSESTSKVPLLGDIPIIGWLFKARTRDNTKTNLVILLTPHIVRGPEDIRGLTKRYNKRRKRFLKEASGGRYQDSFFMEPLILPEEVATPEHRVESPDEERIETPAPEGESVSPPPRPDAFTPEAGDKSVTPVPEAFTPEGEGEGGGSTAAPEPEPFTPDEQNQ